MIFNFNSKTEITHAFDESMFTQLTTMANVTASNLKTIYGNGFVTLKKRDGTDAKDLLVYIDGNTTPFAVTMQGGGNTVGNVLRLYFQESIRFEPYSNHTFFCQTLLADVVLPKKYNITQGVIAKNVEFSLVGKGKIIIANDVVGTTYSATIDGQTIAVDLNAQHCVDIYFTKSFKCKTGYELNYIAYVEIEN